MNYGDIQTKVLSILVDIPTELSGDVLGFIHQAQRDAEDRHQFKATEGSLVVDCTVGSQLAQVVRNTLPDAENAVFLRPLDDLPFGSEVSTPIADSGVQDIDFIEFATDPITARLNLVVLATPDDSWDNLGFTVGMRVNLVAGFLAAPLLNWLVTEVDVNGNGLAVVQDVGAGTSQSFLGDGDEQVQSVVERAGINKFPLGWIEGDSLRSQYGGNPSNGTPRHIEMRMGADEQPSFYLYPTPDKAYTIEIPGVFRLSGDANTVPGIAETNWFTQHGSRYLEYRAAAELFARTRDYENMVIWEQRAQQQLRTLIKSDRALRAFRDEMPVRSGPRNSRTPRTLRF